MNAMMAIETMGKPGLALDIPKNQSFDQWVEMGRSLCEGQRVVNWWIGDWWNAGERKYGEAKAAAAAARIFGKEYETVRQCGYVCSRFGSGDRSPDLTFTHHLRTAPLVHVEKDKAGHIVVVDNLSAKAVLEQAAAENLTVQKVRVEVMKRRVALGMFKPPERTDPDPAYDALMEGVRWWNRQALETRLEFFDLAAEADGGVIRA